MPRLRTGGVVAVSASGVLGDPGTATAEAGARYLAAMVTDCARRVLAAGSRRHADVTDVLIVGAGSAGSILAERLSADPQCNVMVLEAGPGFDDPAVGTLTADGLTLPIGPASPVARRYATTLTRDPPRQAQIVRGMCVGGSGAINGGYFCRGLPGDAVPLPGWSEPEVDAHHRRSGPVSRSASPMSSVRSQPHSSVLPNGPATPGWTLSDRDGTGVAPVPLNIADGRRLGPGAAFLQPAMRRPNLAVRSRTRATGIRIVAGRAVGVDAVGPDGPVDLSADRVVLAAGAIVGSVALMLSGIGPAGPVACARHPGRRGSAGGATQLGSPEWLLPTRRRALGHGGRASAGAGGGAGDPDLEVRPYTTGFGAPAPTSA